METVFFGSLKCDSQEEFDNFLATLEPQGAVAILVAATAYAQGKEVYSKQESELIVNCVRKLVTPDQFEKMTRVTNISDKNK